MSEERTDIPITEEDIVRIIKGYQKQDRKAGRDVVDLSIEEVKQVLANKICHKCENQVTAKNWTLGRIHQDESYSYNNLQLECRHCNVKNKDKEQ